VFTHHPQYQAAWLLAQLRERHILVRYFAKPRIDGHLRISIGTQPECEALVAALQNIASAHPDHTVEASA
jgi:histidinol-phosphate aminotransferase